MRLGPEAATKRSKAAEVPPCCYTSFVGGLDVLLLFTPKPHECAQDQEIGERGVLAKAASVAASDASAGGGNVVAHCAVLIVFVIATIHITVIVIAVIIIVVVSVAIGAVASDFAAKVAGKTAVLV